MKVKQLLHKYHELIVYSIFGGLTTAVNFITYFIFTQIFNVDLVYSNIIAWLVSVFFAFFTNKVYVFKKSDFDLKDTTIEFTKFTSVRAISGAFETGALWWIVHYLHGNELLTKFVLGIIVVVCNYTLSKIYIFVEKEEETHKSRKLKAHVK